MKFSTFGKTNKRVSWLGMGGMRFEKEIPEKDCIALIRHTNELGINYFDTAPVYNEDRSEGIYGRAFKEMDRDHFFVATKGDNRKSAIDIEKTIERSLKRLNIQEIDFYFLWCIISRDEFIKSKMKGRSLEGIIRAKQRGLIRHIGVSTHVYSDDIKELVDSDMFEFIMMPYNALNFKQRELGLRHASDKNLGTVVMNPMYGGVIPLYNNQLEIYSNSNNEVLEDALLFCLESPYIHVTLSGMNNREQVSQNVEIFRKAQKITEKEQIRKEHRIESGMTDLCTSCGYCLRHCPENINIKAYMEIYNTWQLSGSLEVTKERYNWYHQFGPLYGNKKYPSDCTECLACEEECTQYLKITDRLKWLDENM